MYKDKEKQREANKRAAQKRRNKAKGMTQGMTLAANVIPKPTQNVIPAKHCPSLTVMERLFYRPAHKLKAGEHNFVSLPGRACYRVYK